MEHLAYARKPDNDSPEELPALMTPVNGSMIVDIAAEFKKPRPGMKKICSIIDTWPGFSDDGKFHLKAVFGDRYLFNCSPGDPATGNLQRSRMLEIIGRGLIDGKSIDDIVMAIHEKYPGFDEPSCYFMAGNSDHSLFPTLKKIAGAFHRDWRGHDGGGAGYYEEWEDEMQAISIAIEMRSHGKTGEQVVAYLEEKFVYLNDLIDLVKRGEPLSLDIVDRQGDAGRAKRAEYCRF
jgi:hypothetical protein